MADDKRFGKRQPVRLDAMTYDRDGHPLLACALRNVSATGAQLEFVKDVEIPTLFLLSLSRDGRVRRRCTKVWQLSTVVGVRFAEPPDPPGYSSPL